MRLASVQVLLPQSRHSWIFQYNIRISRGIGRESAGQMFYCADRVSAQSFSDSAGE
jgi:hypothetical protein